LPQLGVLRFVHQTHIRADVPGAVVFFKRPGRLSDYHLRSFPRSTFDRLEFLLKFGQPAFLGCDHGQQSLGKVHVAPFITLPLQLVRPQHGVQRPGKYLHNGLVAFGWIVWFQQLVNFLNAFLRDLWL
jgi:hypothetical protein